MPNEQNKKKTAWTHRCKTNVRRCTTRTKCQSVTVLMSIRWFAWFILSGEQWCCGTSAVRTEQPQLSSAPPHLTPQINENRSAEEKTGDLKSFWIHLSSLQMSGGEILKSFDRGELVWAFICSFNTQSVSVFSFIYFISYSGIFRHQWHYNDVWKYNNLLKHVVYNLASSQKNNTV